MQEKLCLDILTLRIPYVVFRAECVMLVRKIPVRQDMTAINNFYLVAGVSGDHILKN